MTTYQPTKSYESIRIDGPISVKRVEDPDSMYLNNIVLLLGPTGSGKSSFIEALAPKGLLQISSHLLEGCTQSISVYRVENMMRHMYGDEAVCIVDVPGFGDTKISEMSIVAMVKEWMKRMHITAVGRILYFTPINVVRLPGSQRQLLKIFQTLTGIEAARNIIVVSTMWDSLSGERSLHHAQRNFEQLQDVVWKDYIQNGSLIVKFDNTPESALSTLDDACRTLVSKDFYIEKSSLPQEAVYRADLYNNLQIRIQNLQIQQANVLSELAVATSPSDAQLFTVLSSQLEETERLLAKFGQELEDFRPPPGFPMGEVSTLPLASDEGRYDMAAPSMSSESHELTSPPYPNPDKRGVVARAIFSLRC